MEEGECNNFFLSLFRISEKNENQKCITKKHEL